MANFKRGRPKNRRAGCKLCKPWKINKPRKKSSATIQERKAQEAYGKELDGQ